MNRYHRCFLDHDEIRCWSLVLTGHEGMCLTAGQPPWMVAQWKWSIHGPHSGWGQARQTINIDTWFYMWTSKNVQPIPLSACLSRHYYNGMQIEETADILSNYVFIKDSAFFSPSRIIVNDMRTSYELWVMKGFSIGIFNLKSLVPENQYVSVAAFECNFPHVTGFLSPLLSFSQSFFFFFKEWIIPGFSMKQAAIL